jgi:glycosyltransferase involved in cell wall biosynthesis
MRKQKLVRITTIPLSLEKLLVGQLAHMQQFYEVIAISAETEKLEAFGIAEGVRTKYVNLTRKITPIKDVLAVYALYKFLRKEKPEIVHSHTPKAGIVGMLAAYFAGVPHRLHTVAGLPLMEARGFKRTVLNVVEKLTYRCATKVYPNSKGLKDFIEAEKFTKPSKLKIIGQGSSNGIDTQYFDPSHYTDTRNIFRQDHNIPQDSFLFVFVGRLVGDKGINELVAAFQSLNSPLITHHLRLLLVGPFEEELDPLKAETLQAIENNPNIIAVGYQNDVRPYFAAADALVFPSYREGFPNVVMQAGAMGLPSIVSNINGCNEIVEEGKNGTIIAVKDAQAILEKMTLFLEDNTYYKHLKQNARPMICERYEQKVVWEALLDEYNALCLPEAGGI